MVFLLSCFELTADGRGRPQTLIKIICTIIITFGFIETIAFFSVGSAGRKARVYLRVSAVHHNLLFGQVEHHALDLCFRVSKIYQQAHLNTGCFQIVQ